MHPGYAVMVPRNKSEHIISNNLVLVGVNAVDTSDVEANTCEKGFPARNRVRPDDRVGRAELVVYI